MLENLLVKGDYKYHITKRIKEIDSLKQKYQTKKRRLKTYTKLEEIEDIAGIRVVFYTDVERKRFISELRNEFEKTLTVKETEKKSGYRSTHIIASFGPKRTSLSEYSKFVNLKCEIQLTLILNHAWAEIEHDILYKGASHYNGLNKADTKLLKTRLQYIMSNYINNASVEFEKIVKYVKGLHASNKKKEKTPK